MGKGGGDSPEKGMMFDASLPKSFGRPVIGQPKSDGLLIFIIFRGADAEIGIIALKEILTAMEIKLMSWS